MEWNTPGILSLMRGTCCSGLVVAAEEIPQTTSHNDAGSSTRVRGLVGFLAKNECEI